MSKIRNPYPGRPYPVGQLEYKIESDEGRRSVKTVIPFAMLEYGEAELLYDLPRLAGGGNLANLGHAQGGSAILMAKSLRDNKLDGVVFSVDVFKCDSRSTDFGFQKVKDVIEAHDIKAWLSLYRGTTDKWGEKFKALDVKFNLLFIDADHSYEGVSNDFKLWSPMLNVGGLVALHDTNQEFSHKVVVENLVENSVWREHENLHVNRVRVFERVSND